MFGKTQRAAFFIRFVPQRLDCYEVMSKSRECIKMAEDKNKKVKQAVALEYDPADSAPRVIAMGRGALAEKIIEQAKQADVPVHKDDKLANTLSKLQIGDMIPPELYEVVAEILMFVDSLDKIKAIVSAYQNSKK